jgi:hypothetical protein
MGIIKVTAAITNLTKTGNQYESEFLVETEAIDCMVPGLDFVSAGDSG